MTFLKTAVFELRTYAIKPTHVGKYVALSNEKFHLRTEHSQLNGFFIHELGGTLNAFTHIWQYDSLAHRASVRHTLANNQAWINEYVVNLLPCLDSQVNKVCKIPEWSHKYANFDLIEPKYDGSKQAPAYNMITVDDDELTEKDCEDFVKKMLEIKGVKFHAVYETVLGDTDEKTFFFRHEDLDSTINDIRLPNQQSLVMLPTAWSPMK